MRPGVLALLCLLALPASAGNGEGPVRFDDRPSFGQPLKFTDVAGNTYRPRRLVLLTPANSVNGGASAAKLPHS